MKKHILLSYVNLLTSIIIGFITAPLIAGFLGQSGYGVFNLLLSITFYSQLMQFGMGNAIVRFTAKYTSEGRPEKAHQTVSFSLLFSLTMAMISLMIGFVIWLNFGNWFKVDSDMLSIAKTAFVLSLMNASLSIPGYIFPCFIQGHNKYTLYNVATIIRTVARLPLLLLAFSMKGGIVAVFAIDLGLTILYFLLFIGQAFFVNKLKIDLFHIPRHMVRETFGYSTFVFINSVVAVLFWRTDLIILGTVSNTVEVAIYAVAMNLVGYMKQFSSTFSSTMLPTLTNMVVVENEDSLKKLRSFFESASRYQFLIIYLLFFNFLFIGQDFIQLWMGPDYRQSFFYALIVLVPLLIPLSQSTGDEILYAMNRMKFRSYVLLAIAAANVISTIFLIPILGTAGAAWATAVSLVLGQTIIMNLYYKHLLKISLLQFFSHVFVKPLLTSLPAALLFLGAAPLLSGLSGFSGFILKALALNIPLVLLFLFLVLKHDERKQILGRLHLGKRP